MNNRHFELRKKGKIEYFICKELEKLKWLTHAFSTRLGGISPLPKDALNLTFIDADAKENVIINRNKFLKALHIPHGFLRTAKQIHSNKVVVLDGTDNYKIDSKPVGDALITDQSNLALAIQVADCYPILIVDLNRRVIANIHAGWRSTLGGIVENTLEILQKHFECSTKNLLAIIGPGIGKCCYEVGGEVVEQFSEFLPNGKTFWQPSLTGTYYLDLLSIFKYQLQNFGLSTKQVIALELCTSCNSDLFFSYRKEGKNSGRMMSIILRK
jgi:hypothetical protein